MRTVITREHEICCGHRVYGHEGKCNRLHGHGYVFQFTVTGPELDVLGRIIDFSVIKTSLCQWLEDNWDHRTLIWIQDPVGGDLKQLFPGSVVLVPFNPTAEQMAQYLLQIIGPCQLLESGVTLTAVRVWETRKCSATALGEDHV